MALGRMFKSRNRKHKKAGRRRRWLALVARPFFAPVVGLWGALLGGLTVIVVPAETLESLAEGTLLATFDIPVQLQLAGGSAVVLGGLLFVLAAAKSADARRRLNPRSILNLVNRKVSPIDPVRDLGSKSIDEPVETMPFATPAWRDADLEPAAAEKPAVPAAPETREAAPECEAEAPLPRVMRHPLPESAEAAVPQPSSQSVPLELDLAQFAELPGRNAVWVEEPVAPVAPPAPEPEAAPQPVGAPAVAAVPDPAPRTLRPRRPATPPPLPGTAALARLRAVPPGELSMVEMVERFAGALHEHRSNAPARTRTAAELAAREAALAEALKALAALSGIGGEAAPADRDAPLRAALSQLQPRRGAA